MIFLCHFWQISLAQINPFPLSIFPDGWQKVSLSEQEVIKKRVYSALDSLQCAKPVIIDMQVRPLLCYKNAFLIEIMGKIEDRILTYSALKSENHFVFLYGQSKSLYDFNEIYTLDLSTDEQAIEYVRLFVATLKSLEGNFRMISSPEIYRKLEGWKVPDSLLTNKVFEPFVIYRSDEKIQLVGITKYSDFLYRNIFNIDFKGSVSMGSDIPLSFKPTFTFVEKYIEGGLALSTKNGAARDTLLANVPHFLLANSRKNNIDMGFAFTSDSLLRGNFILKNNTETTITIKEISCQKKGVGLSFKNTMLLPGDSTLFSVRFLTQTIGSQDCLCEVEIVSEGPSDKVGFNISATILEDNNLYRQVIFKNLNIPKRDILNLYQDMISETLHCYYQKCDTNNMEVVAFGELARLENTEVIFTGSFTIQEKGRKDPGQKLLYKAFFRVLQDDILLDQIVIWRDSKSAVDISICGKCLYGYSLKQNSIHPPIRVKG